MLKLIKLEEVESRQVVIVKNIDGTTDIYTGLKKEGRNFSAHKVRFTFDGKDVYLEPRSICFSGAYGSILVLALN